MDPTRNPQNRKKDIQSPLADTGTSVPQGPFRRTYPEVPGGGILLGV